MYLKVLCSLCPNGLLVRLWVYKTNVASSNPPRAAYSNSAYKISIIKLFSFFLRNHKKFYTLNNYKTLFLFRKKFFFDERNIQLNLALMFRKFTKRTNSAAIPSI